MPPLSKDEIFEFIRRFDEEELRGLFRNTSYLIRLNIFLANKAYRRKLISTLLHLASDIKEEGLAEADMSRRDFLKTAGKAAAAAATPQSALKGLLSSAPQNFALPKTAAQMNVALLQLIKDRNLIALWTKNAHRAMADWRDSPAFYAILKDKGQTEQDVINSMIENDKEELMSLANPGDEWYSIEDLPHVLDSFSDDSYFRDKIFGGPLPDWLTRYRVSLFMGREVGMDHPFVKNRDKWRDYIGSTEYSIPNAEVENEFINIIASSATPKRVKTLFGVEGPKLWTQEELEKRYEETYGYKLPKKELKPKEKPQEKPEEKTQEEPDSWRTQHVEFEHKLVARLRRL